MKKLVSQECAKAEVCFYLWLSHLQDFGNCSLWKLRFWKHVVRYILIKIVKTIHNWQPMSTSFLPRPTWSCFVIKDGSDIHHFTFHWTGFNLIQTFRIAKKTARRVIKILGRRKMFCISGCNNRVALFV